MRDGLNGRSYTNPVYGGYLGDPFVWRHDGVWYAVGSGAPEAKLAVDELRFRAARTGRQTRLFPLLRRRTSSHGGRRAPPSSRPTRPSATTSRPPRSPSPTAASTSTTRSGG